MKQENMSYFLSNWELAMPKLRVPEKGDSEGTEKPHYWEQIVPDLDPAKIANIVKETIQYGVDAPYDGNVMSKVLNVTRNGITKPVQVPYFVLPNGKITFGNAFIDI